MLSRVHIAASVSAIAACVAVQAWATPPTPEAGARAGAAFAQGVQGTAPPTSCDGGGAQDAAHQAAARLPTATEIPACNMPGGRPIVPANCDDGNDYRRMVFFLHQSFQAIHASRAMVATRLNCLLGTDAITPEMVSGALAEMSNALCNTGAPLSKRPIVVSCSTSPDSSAAWDGNTPADYEGRDFAGAFDFSTGFKRYEHCSDSDPSCKVRQISFIDTLVHESTHALTSYFSKKIPKASTDNAACSVGAMPNTIRGVCDPTEVTPRRLSGRDSQLLMGKLGGIDYGEPASGRFRNEATARSVAAIIASYGCERTYPLFFEMGQLRQAPQ